MSGNMPAGQQSGFLNSFMSFLGGEGVPEEPVKTPVLPKYIPELPPVHVSTFQGSFLNKMNANDSQTDDNSKDCFSPGKDNCSTGKTPPVMVKESGRKTLSQSGRKMRTRHNQNKD